MPYKIYTYEDPYKLNQTDFWNEISHLPHFCVARTQVNGLLDVMKRDIYALICPLDDLVRHEGIFHSWTDDISLRIQQYTVLTSIFNEKSREGVIDKLFRQSLYQNQSQFLDALRLFIELDIHPSVVDGTKGNKEQRLFVDVLNEVHTNPLFTFPVLSSQTQLKRVISSLAHNELKEYQEIEEKRQDLSWYDRSIKNTENWDGRSLVIHGVHQFSPAQLRLVLALDKMGVTVIFLYNYQSEYSEIYSSWELIYNCFGVDIHHDQNIKSYEMDMLQNPSNALACALGEACKKTSYIGGKEIKDRYELYKDIEVLEFSNITEYAHFVSDCFDEAINSYQDSKRTKDGEKLRWNHSAVLGHIKEQVYTANKDVHNLMRIYYPEYSKNRHFLAYPIGQFFSAIYKLWDTEKKEIKISVPELKECLSSNVLKAGKSEELLRTFSNLLIMFDRLDSYSVFEERIAKAYLSNYDRIQKSVKTDVLSSLKSLAMYNPHITTRKNVEELIAAIEEINEIATSLFATNKNEEDYINFGKHFQNLQAFLKKREMSLASEEEKQLIVDLQKRMSQIRPEKSNFSGSFKDLREGLYYYLKQKEEERVDWIVKNYEQIDGDILQSKRQWKEGGDKIYHFACVSDRDLNSKVDDLLPWPLTDLFIRKAYSPIDLQFQVYYSALGERGNFLRYALFYGLCFNYKDTRLSYVKQYEDEATELYALVSILGLKAVPRRAYVNTNAAGCKEDLSSCTITSMQASGPQLMDMFLCPYRFFMDYVLQDSPVIKDRLLYDKLYENLIVEQVWKKLTNKPKKIAQEALKKEVKLASDSIRPYFSFWLDIEIEDIKRKAENYFNNHLLDNSRVKSFDQNHMDIRKIFNNAIFKVNIKEREPVHPYSSFEGKTTKKGNEKTYNYYKVNPKNPKANKADLIEDMRSYICQTGATEHLAIPCANWCHYCPNRGVCLMPFLTEE